MKTVLNITYAVVTLWTIISISTSEQSDTSKFPSNFSAYTEYFKPQKNVAALNGTGEVSSTVVLSVSTSFISTSTALPSETNSLSSQLSSVSPVALNAEEIQKLGHILEQDKTVPTSPKPPQATEQTATSKADTVLVETNITKNSFTQTTMTNNTSTTSGPKVVLPTEDAKTYLDGFFKTSLAWMGDQYTLSIVVPILAGFLFAMVIIVTIATFSCIRRRCRRRRLKKKILPETIRKMGPSDRARLLAETSDEEF